MIIGVQAKAGVLRWSTRDARVGSTAAAIPAHALKLMLLKRARPFASAALPVLAPLAIPLLEIFIRLLKLAQ